MKGALQALEYKNGMKDLKTTKIPYICIMNPTKLHLTITINRNPPTKKPVPFHLPN